VGNGVGVWDGSSAASLSLISTLFTGSESFGNILVNYPIMGGASLTDSHSIANTSSTSLVFV
jgi:hypothetical protein